MLHFHKWIYGKYDGKYFRKCQKCEKVQFNEYEDWEDTRHRCYICKGYGTTLYKIQNNLEPCKCISCNGTGFVDELARLLKCNIDILDG